LLVSLACSPDKPAQDGGGGNAGAQTGTGGLLDSTGGVGTGGGSSTGGSSTGGVTQTAGSGGQAGSAQGGATATGGKASTGGVSATGGTVSQSGGSAGKSSTGGAGTPPPDPCVTAGGCPPGKWISVTPASVDLVNGACGNYGTKSVQSDANHPQDFYTLFFCQGVWKSSDYGQTWTGPINKGASGAMFGDCAGGITIPPNNTADPPTLYASCIRGAGLGFWRSTNGGVDWTRYNVAPSTKTQEFYPPVVDPYDAKHLLMVGHAVDVLVQSVDGGQTWTSVPTNAGMAQPGGTGGIAFVDTGMASTTRDTWLWLGSQSGGNIGTWRTSNAGIAWKKVEKNEHTNGATQVVYQPDKSGAVFMTGVYSDLGWGVLRSTDYGESWAHVGGAAQEAVVFGTAKNVYAMFGWGIGAGMMVDPSLQIGSLPGTGTWTMPGTPAAMTQGPAQAAVSNDGKNGIVVVANYNAGLWRYIEP